MDQAGWQRTWGAEDSGQLVGHLDLKTGLLPTELHRVALGIGIEATYRKRGLGRTLMETAIAWAKEQQTIGWIDIGVFANNVPAIHLYQKIGFRETGRLNDRFRVDSQSIDDIQMALKIR